ncbi:MAG: homoserine kinase [Alphaproteobacteria bacterium]|nr:homoserine kinase [Alphaproteobacteria bacterium]
MAVYTSVSDADLNTFLADYDIGEAVSFKGIAEGVENSNYYLETTTGRYILTLFEKRANPQDLPYFIALKQHLAAHGFACPTPVAARDGQALRTLAGRPSVIVTFLTGMSPKRPSARQCRALGKGLAELHAAARDFPMQRANGLGPASWPNLWQGRAETAEQLQSGLAALIEGDLEAISKANPQSLNLPRGTIHADLFPDNAFFLGDLFSGAIDFYFACTDALVYDLAICLNAWAFEPNGDYNFSKGRNLIAGYESVRPLEPVEREALPVLARGAALRFFLTRLVDWRDTPADALVKPHDPLDYAVRLAFHRRVVGPADYGA